jgi:hypothetical protein
MLYVMLSYILDVIRYILHTIRELYVTSYKLQDFRYMLYVYMRNKIKYDTHVVHNTSTLNTCGDCDCGDY